MVVQLDVMLSILKNGTVLRTVTFVRTVHRTVEHAHMHSSVSLVSQDTGVVSARTAVRVANITHAINLGDVPVAVNTVFIARQH